MGYRLSLSLSLPLQEENTDKLTKFIEILNGKDRTRCGIDSLPAVCVYLHHVLSLASHLVTAHPGPLLSDVLLSSPILTDEEGAPLAPLGQGFEFGIDPAEDPELAMVYILAYLEPYQLMCWLSCNF